MIPIENKDIKKLEKLVEILNNNTNKYFYINKINDGGKVMIYEGTKKYMECKNKIKIDGNYMKYKWFHNIYKINELIDVDLSIIYEMDRIKQKYITPTNFLFNKYYYNVKYNFENTKLINIDYEDFKWNVKEGKELLYYDINYDETIEILEKLNIKTKNVKYENNKKYIKIDENIKYIYNKKIKKNIKNFIHDRIYEEMDKNEVDDELKTKIIYYINIVLYKLLLDNYYIDKVRIGHNYSLNYKNKKIIISYIIDKIYINEDLDIIYKNIKNYLNKINFNYIGLGKKSKNNKFNIKNDEVEFED